MMIIAKLLIIKLYVGTDVTCCLYLQGLRDLCRRWRLVVSETLVPSCHSTQRHILLLWNCIITGICFDLCRVCILGMCPIDKTCYLSLISAPEKSKRVLNIHFRVLAYVLVRPRSVKLELVRYKPGKVFVWM
jgi:hypothetical protein